MKKLLTTLTLLSALLIGLSAQEPAAGCKDMKPGMGPGMGMAHEGCPQMGSMKKGMGGCDKMGKGGCDMDEMGDGGHRGPMGPMMFEKLDLTKEQMDKIHQIKIKYEKLDIDSKAELKKLQIDKQEAMMEMNFDKAKEFTKKMSDVRTKTQIGNIDEMSEMSKVLTKEQLDKMKEFHKAPGMMKHKMMKKD